MRNTRTCTARAFTFPFLSPQDNMSYADLESPFSREVSQRALGNPSLPSSGH